MTSLPRIACSIHVLLLPVLTLLVASVSAGEGVVINAETFLNRGLADCGFQQAIEEAAAQGGGTVRLPAGEFALRRGLVLKRGVELVGAGMGKTTLLPARRVRRLEVVEDGPQDDRVVLKAIPDDLVVGSAVISCRWFPPPWYGSPRPAVVTAIDRETNTVTLKAPYGLNRMAAGKGLLTFGLAAAPARDVHEGDTEIHLEDASLFRAGDELALGEPPNESLKAHVFVREVRGNTLMLEEPARIDFAAWPDNTKIGNKKVNALVWALFPLVHAANVEACAVRDLTIRGHGVDSIRPMQTRYTLSGIHIYNGQNIRIERVAVRDWPSDGISLQTGQDYHVTACEVTGCLGNGLHPGTGLKGSTFENNIVTGNGVGLYFCWHNRGHRIIGNRFLDNRGGGITGLGHPGDRDNLIEGNLVAGNGGAGITINGGGRDSGNVIRGNTIENNSQGEPGKHPGIAVHPRADDARGYLITENTIRDMQETPTQHVGIEEKNGSHNGKPNYADENTIIGNSFRGHKTADVVIVGPKTVCNQDGAAVVRPKR